MSQNPPTLEPALCYEFEGVWYAWNTLGQQVLCGMGAFVIADALLRHRGYYQVPLNSPLAGQIREQLRQVHNITPDELK